MSEELTEGEEYWVKLFWILAVMLAVAFAMSYPIQLPSQNCCGWCDIGQQENCTAVVQEHQVQFQNQTPLENPVNVLCGTGDWKLENYMVEGDCHDNVCDMVLHVRCVGV